LEIVTLSGKSVHVGITATDSSGNTAQDSIFVELKDQQGPSIFRVSPVVDTTVGNATKSVQIRLAVKDVSGIDSVKIGGRRIDTAANGEYASTNIFPLYEQELTIRATAWDRLGNKTDSVIVFRRRDPVVISGPVPNLVQPTSRKGASLADTTDSIQVKWSVSSLLKLSDTAVRIDGNLARRENDTVWSAKVAVPATGQEYAIAMVATDTSGRTGKDTVWVTRAAPSITLSVLFDSTKGDPALRQGLYVTMLDSVRIPWKVDGNCPGCGFLIDGTKVELSAGLTAMGVKLPMGESSHELDASVAGVVVAKSVVKIRRYGAMTVKVEDGDRDTVGLADTSGTAVWSVRGAVSVSIDGSSQNLSATGLYSKSLTGLRQGPNRSTLVAIDSLGKSTTSDAGVYKLSAVDLVVTPPKDSSWDSAVYKIASGTPGVALTWSTDSTTWNSVSSNGSVALYRRNRLYVRASAPGFSKESQSFPPLHIRHTNATPRFHKRDTIVIALEDAGPIRMLWCDSLSPGGEWDSAQRIRFVLSPIGKSTSYFVNAPTIDSVTGILTFQTTKNAFGTVKFRVILKDDGGTTNRGIDSSVVDSLVIKITPVNDAPRFLLTSFSDISQIGESKMLGVTENNNKGMQLIGPGGSDDWLEYDTPNFQVVPSNDFASNCFENPPTVYNQMSIELGKPVFYQAIGYKSRKTCGDGTAEFLLKVKDGGGTANGGVDSSSIPFTIQLTNTVKGNDGIVHHFRQYGNTIWMLENMGAGPTGAFYDPSDTSNACPTGWRLPRAGEWDTLVVLSKGLQHLRTGNWWTIQSNSMSLGGPRTYDTLQSVADNSMGFGLLATETSSEDGNFIILESKTEFWTSSPDRPYAYFGRDFNLGQMRRLQDNPLGQGESVRCVQ